MSLPERVATSAYLVLEAALPLAYGLAIVTFPFDSRFGAFVVIAVLLLRFLARNLFLGVILRHEGAMDDLSTAERRSLGVGFGFYLLVFVGAFAALFGSPAGAALMVVGLSGHIAGHVVAAASAYRRIMARPWPAVQPLTDENDDWW